MPDTTDNPKTTADRLKEAVKLMNGQKERTFEMLVSEVIRLSERVETLEKRAIRTVVKVR